MKNQGPLYKGDITLKDGSKWTVIKTLDIYSIKDKAYQALKKAFTNDRYEYTLRGQYSTIIMGEARLTDNILI